MSGMCENKLFTLIQKTLDFRTQRQDLLTSNIANKDTPGYKAEDMVCLLYTSPSPRDQRGSRMPSSA